MAVIASTSVLSARERGTRVSDESLDQVVILRARLTLDATRRVNARHLRRVDEVRHVARGQSPAATTGTENARRFRWSGE